MAVVRHKEAIHSGHFMVSHFEAEAADDDEENIGVTVPEEGSNANTVPDVVAEETTNQTNQFSPLLSFLDQTSVHCPNSLIDVSLNKLFQCMSLAYRQKLTSPKWNRFRGMKLRWKDKIRLNNVIWRCWHMQFIKGHRRLVCAFANPLDIDNHNKTEAGAILEGKYWKRKLNTVTAEYKKWRIFYKQQNDDFNHLATAQYPNDHFMDVTNTLYQYGTKDDVELENMITDADFFVDALFNSLGSQSDSTWRDSIMASLDDPGPSLDELMDLDPMAPLQEWLATSLPENVERGKSLTPDQDVFNLPVQDVKAIDVLEASYNGYPPTMQAPAHRRTMSENIGVKTGFGAVQGLRPDDIVEEELTTVEEAESRPQPQPQPQVQQEKQKTWTGRGKLWSAAVREAQEQELRLKQQEEQQRQEQLKQQRQEQTSQQQQQKDQLNQEGTMQQSNIYRDVLISGKEDGQEHPIGLHSADGYLAPSSSRPSGRGVVDLKTGGTEVPTSRRSEARGVQYKTVLEAIDQPLGSQAQQITYNQQQAQHQVYPHEASEQPAAQSPYPQTVGHQLSVIRDNRRPTVLQQPSSSRISSGGLSTSNLQQLSSARAASSSQQQTSSTRTSTNSLAASSTCPNNLTTLTSSRQFGLSRTRSMSSIGSGSSASSEPCVVVRPDINYIRNYSPPPDTNRHPTPPRSDFLLGSHSNSPSPLPMLNRSGRAGFSGSAARGQEDKTRSTEQHTRSLAQSDVNKIPTSISQLSSHRGPYISMSSGLSTSGVNNIGEDAVGGGNNEFFRPTAAGESHKMLKSSDNDAEMAGRPTVFQGDAGSRMDSSHRQMFHADQAGVLRPGSSQMQQSHSDFPSAVAGISRDPTKHQQSHQFIMEDNGQAEHRHHRKSLAHSDTASIPMVSVPIGVSQGSTIVSCGNMSSSVLNLTMSKMVESMAGVGGSSTKPGLTVNQPQHLRHASGDSLMRSTGGLVDQGNHPPTSINANNQASTSPALDINHSLFLGTNLGASGMRENGKKFPTRHFSEGGLLSRGPPPATHLVQLLKEEPRFPAKTQTIQSGELNCSNIAGKSSASQSGDMYLSNSSFSGRTASQPPDLNNSSSSSTSTSSMKRSNSNASGIHVKVEKSEDMPGGPYSDQGGAVWCAAQDLSTTSSLTIQSRNTSQMGRTWSGLSFRGGSMAGPSFSTEFSIPPPPASGPPQPSMFLDVPGESLESPRSRMGDVKSPGDSDNNRLSFAEQKRRCTIKNGFDYFKTTVPSLAQSPSAKISKASLLLKGAEYISQLKKEKEDMHKTISTLRETVEQLNDDIRKFQEELSPSGRAQQNKNTNRGSEMQDMFVEHVVRCTMQNWKYWVFAKIFHQLVLSYDSTISCNSKEDFKRTIHGWLDQQASITNIRPMVINALKDLSIETEILTFPHKMPQEALTAVTTRRVKKEEAPSSVGPSRHNSGMDTSMSRSPFSPSDYQLP